MPAFLRHYQDVLKESRSATDEELLRWYGKAARQGRVSKVTRARVAWDELKRRGWTSTQIMEGHRDL